MHILLLVLIGQSTNMVQLVKLPKLFEHFKEHRALNPEVGMLKYLSMHYWGEDFNDDDDEKDMQLPFKKYDINILATLFVSNHKLPALTPHNWIIEKDFGIEQPDFYYNPAGQSLFRPPRA
ncbi:hypothetical protein [Pseudobacter ginsenosidimutans]|uniref:Uncharacterized protein n=2 Tax=Chitinophagaceae TaxID=563835 RepID=A0A4Q7MRM9_9BACT|nr:hypothetical protein [Pseudobacter ginsenosidimutans]QEC42073.1 hypothetical protein FSB84_10385 [Pseudobacter ginsenosidimutans]RZS71088.1 hypothetical protein EV199_2989 [Pseudobacter ginsenosidimutans]